MYGTAEWAGQPDRCPAPGWETSHICWTISFMIWQTLLQRNLGYFSLIWDWGGQVWCHRWAFFICQWLLSWHFTSLLHNAKKSFAVNWNADYWWLSSAVNFLMQRSRTWLGWTWVWKVFLYHAGQIYVWNLFLFMYFSWPLQLRLHCD